jgi:hypothetical protein
MASTVVNSQGIGWVELKLNFDQYFGTDYYYTAGVADNPFTSGSLTEPDGLLGWEYAEDGTGTYRYVYVVVNVIPGIYQSFYGFVQKVDDKYYSIGSDSCYTYPETMPDDPYFDNAVLVGSNSVRLYFTKAIGVQYTEVYWNTSGTDPKYGVSYDARTTSSTSILVSGLPYNDTVYFWLRSRDFAGNMGEWVYCQMLDTGAPPAPTPPIIINRFDGGLDLQCGSVNLADTYYFEYRKQGTTTWTTVTSGTNTLTITGMQYGTAYEFRASTDLIATYSSINVGTTLPKKPTISVTAITYDAITVQVAALPNNCDKVKVECYELGGTFAGMNWIDPAGRTFPAPMATSFAGLNRNFAYYFIATSLYDAGGDGTGTGIWLESVPSDSVNATTLNRPNNWAWSYNMISGGNVYQSSYNAGTKVLTAYIMPYAEWNSFTAKINDFRTYKGLAGYAFTTVATGTNVTPSLINQAINAINPMLDVSLRMSNVVVGNIYAATFNTMRDKLNSL